MNMKKTAALLLGSTVCLLQIGMLPASADDNVQSGTCGEYLTWTLDAAGCLTVSGTGKMSDEQPWAEYKDGIITAVLSDGVEYIGKGAFFECANLETVTLPDSVTSIGETAFWDCNSLREISIPADVTEIGSGAFRGCSLLTEVTLPAGVTSLGSQVFAYCIQLKSIVLPEAVSNIGMMAFCNCSALESVTVKNPDCAIWDRQTTICNSSTDLSYSGEICGCAGSTAEEYARRYGITFRALESPAGEKGDLDGDGEIGVADAQKVLLAYVESITSGSSGLTDAQTAAADVDGDGQITVSDAQFILNYYVQNVILGANVSWEKIIPA